MKKLLSIVLWILLVGGTAFAAQKWVRDANPFHVFQAIKVTSNWSLSWDCFFQAQNWVVSDCQGNSFLTGAVGDFLPLSGNTITTPMSWDIYIDNNRALYWWDIYTFIQAEDTTPEMNMVAWQWFGPYLKWWINLLHNQVNLFIKQWANTLYGVSLWNTWALTYKDDYSTHFVDRSLIDKWYADNTYVPKTLPSDIIVTWNMHSLSFNTMINYSINTIWFYLNNLAGGNVLSRWASWLRNYVQSYYYSWIIVDTENLVLKRNVYSVFSDTHIPAIATGYSANDRRQGMSGNDIVFNQYDWANWDKRLGMWNSFYVGEDMQTLWDHSAAVGGKMNIASGNYSIVIGWYNNNAWWNYSIIWWQANKAPWTNSVVIWWATNVATWGYSFIGWWSNNKSFWTHSFVAWWDSNVASWVHSFAWWDTSVAYVNNSFAWWVGVEAKTVYWISFWAHNIWYTDALLEIGNGNGITENNAMTLYWASQEYKVEFEWPIGIEWTWTHMAFRFARSWERIEAQYYTWGVWVSAVCSGWKFILP